MGILSKFCSSLFVNNVNEFKPSCIWSKLLEKDEPTFLPYFFIKKKLSNDLGI